MVELVDANLTESSLDIILRTRSGFKIAKETRVDKMAKTAYFMADSVL